MLLHKLSATSALVLLWTKGEIHTSNISSQYLKVLKLKEGEKLLSKCDQVWPFYSEVIKNRKQCILDIVRNSIKKNQIKQIVILGAGMDPLSLEIVDENKNVKIFEIDYSNTSVKQKIIEDIDYDLRNSIKLINGDLTKPKIILKNLLKFGWNKKNRTLVIAEGISYYLSENSLWNVFKIFETENNRNQLVMEYLVPHEDISKRRAIIPDQIFYMISTDMELLSITRYDVNKIKKRLKDLNGKIVKSYTMKEMEKNRTGKNYHFRRAKSGWIEACHCVI